MYDSLVVISYHSDDAFEIIEGSVRASYYSVSGTPTTKFDGIVSVVGGTGYPGTLYPDFSARYSARIGISSPLEIRLNCTYDSAANSGTVNARVLNTSVSEVSGTIQFVLVEDDKPYAWGGGLTELRFVMRDMLPDASGEAVTIPVSDTIIRSRSFTVDPSWNENNCRIIIFVQASTKEIYQGAEIALIPQENMQYSGYIMNETSGNGNGIPEPGESIELNILAKNMGTGNYSGTTVIQSSDPYITITGATPASVDIASGDVDTVVDFQFDISAGCPNPHTTEFEIGFGSAVDSIPFMITTNPGFSDDMEAGQGSWTHSGLRDYWHLTEHKYHTATHAWYFGTEGSWTYSSNCDGSLMTPYFIALPDSPLYFYHQYGLETNYDYGYVEVDNGSGFWQTLDQFTGSQSSWTYEALSLTDYSGKTVRIRFRLMSDGSLNFEGWYIDDVWVGSPPLGIGNFVDQNPRIIGLEVFPNPFRQVTEIGFQMQDAGCKMQDISLQIYDISGRVVKSFDLASDLIPPGSAVFWFGDDNLGRKVPTGIYFVELHDTHQSLVRKVVLSR